MGRAITVNVGPLTTADPNGISESQAAAGAQYLGINGLLSSGFDADNIATAQNPAGAGNLTLNGALVVSGVAQLGSMKYIVLTCAADETDRTFTVTGTGINAMGLPFSVVDSFVGANASVRVSNKKFYTIISIATSGAGSGNISVGTNGTVTLDKARRIAVDSDGNDSGITFTIAGTNAAGFAQTEVLAGANAGVATSALDFLTVASVLTSAAVATTVEVGSSAVASSPWVRFDDYSEVGEVSIQATVTGTVDYTIQQTMQDTDPNAAPDKVLPYDIAWVNHPDSNVVNASTTQQANYAYPPTFARVLLNSGTGSVSTVFRQMG